ncbi:Alpha/Beta hydrolase protein [Gaertneriomyces semiglobifer]|nr:Alpha/Beta hydrolase protein [Gaertneriomyces semiglobifer]
MLDHALGRPSPGLKRLQILFFSIVACVYRILRTSSDANPRVKLFRFINKRWANSPPWKIVFGTLTLAWLCKNLFLILGLNAPEPLARMYTRSFYRGTYVFTALDAGFFTAMSIKPKWLRDICSVLFSIFYLVFPDTADEKVRKFRAHPTVDLMRVSWNKSLNPYMRLITAPERARITVAKEIVLPRPSPPSITSFPDRELGAITARLFYDGTPAELKKCNELILSFPGGGFVAMGPLCHEDYMSQWAKRTKLPILSIDYGKAPEFPYPYAIEECFDAYRTVMESNGAVLGMQRNDPIKIIVVGDSAGGNIATGVVIRCLETYEMTIRPPNGLVLVYPCLSFDMSCWMPSDSLKLMRAESHHNLSLKSFTESKSSMRKNSPLTPQEAPRKIDVLHDKVDRRESWYHRYNPFRKSSEMKRQQRNGPSIPSHLSMTSRMSYFTDRILAPEFMRAMGLLYLGTSPLPIDLASDYYLSPVMAPDDILARFPKTFLLCGEKDPLIDDTVVFAGRLRENKIKARKEWDKIQRRVGRNGGVKTHIFSRPPDTMVRVKVLEGISHGLFQMSALVPEARHAAGIVGEWFLEILKDENGLGDVGYGDDLTEFLGATTDSGVSDLELNGNNDHQSLQQQDWGPYYPAHGVPQHPKQPHIKLGGKAAQPGILVDSMHTSKGMPSPSNGSNSNVVKFNVEPEPSRTDAVVDGLKKVIPILDEVDERKLLERRRTEIGSTLGL